MTRIAFIGLGVMGSPMAMNLVRAGYDVVGFNRTPEKAEPLRLAGGRVASSVTEAVVDADIVAVMVPDTPDVEAVLAGHDGVFAHASPGTLIIDFSSIRADTTVTLAERARTLKLRLIDAPVSGGETGAKAGTLSVMIGGDADDVAEAMPVMNAVGQTIVHVGANGAGQIVKAANQLVVGANIEALAEALVFVEAHGISGALAFQVLAGGLAGSRVLDQKSENMLQRKFRPGARIRLHEKDLANVLTAARTAGVVLPLGSVVAQLLTSAVANGDGDLDHASLLRGVHRQSGI